jgi:hypothetical protein
VLRHQNGALVLAPAAAIGLDSLNSAAVYQVPEGTPFDQVATAPSQTAFSPTAVPVQPGRVIVVISRGWQVPGAGTCRQYAKLEPLEQDLQAGTVRLQVATNSFCFDDRLQDTS